MNTRLPAVVIAPPRLAVPVLMPFFSSSSNIPSGTRHTMSPVFALTAINSPHGGSLHGYRRLGSQKRPPSGVTLRYGERALGALSSAPGGGPPRRAADSGGASPPRPRPPRLPGPPRPRPSPGFTSSRW